MLKPVSALIRSTALLTVAFLLAACSSPEIEQSSGPSGPDIKRDCVEHKTESQIIESFVLDSLGQLCHSGFCQFDSGLDF